MLESAKSIKVFHVYSPQEGEEPSKVGPFSVYIEGERAVEGQVAADLAQEVLRGIDEAGSDEFFYIAHYAYSFAMQVEGDPGEVFLLFEFSVERVSIAMNDRERCAIHNTTSFAEESIASLFRN